MHKRYRIGEIRMGSMAKRLCPVLSVLVVCLYLLSPEVVGLELREVDGISSPAPKDASAGTHAFGFRQNTVGRNGTSSLSVSPNSLTLIARQGDPNPPALSIRITSNGSPLSWSAAMSSTWLAVMPASGTTPSASQIALNSADLPAGSYLGSITITAFSAVNSKVTVPVSLLITTASGVHASPDSLTFSVIQGESDPASQSISISSAGSALSWTAVADAPWLSTTQATGTTPTAITVSANVAGLQPGSYFGTLTITASGTGNIPIDIPVTLAVAAPAGKAIQTDLSSLAFSANLGDAAPQAQALNLESTGGSMAWSAVPGASWLTAGPGEGTTPSACSISVNAADLSPGVYNSRITITAANAGNSPLVVPVTLTVTAITSIGVSPPSLALAARQGSPNPSAVTLTISSAGGPIIWGVAVDSPWLSLTDTYGTTPSTLRISVNVGGLGVGTYAGKITIAAPGASNTPIRVPVTLTVTAGAIQGN